MKLSALKGSKRTPLPRTPSLGRSLERIAVAVAAMSTASGCSSTGAANPTDPSASVSDASVGLDAGAAAAADTAPPDPCAPVILNPRLFEEAGSTCAEFVSLPCGLSPEAGASGGCTLDPVTCKNACQTNLLFGCSLSSVSCDNGVPVDGAGIVVDCVVCANGIGRRPRGLYALSRARKTSALGEYFARNAFLEAASVAAFRDFRRSLEALGAPTTMRRAASRAMVDERRHARVTARMARRFGGIPARPRVAPSDLPTLPELLFDNAVEGCVGESFGALVALWQGTRAADADVASAMRRIAQDETRHASLSWRVLRWGARRVDETTRRTLSVLIAGALGDLHRSLDARVDPLVSAIAGYPTPEVARSLFAEFEELVLGETRRLLAADAREA